MNILQLFYIRILLIAVILTFFWFDSFARDTDTIVDQLNNDSAIKVETAKQRLDELTKSSKKVKEKFQSDKGFQSDSAIVDPMLPESPNPMLSDSLTKEKYQAALQEYYNYHISGLQHREKVFSWQLFSSKIIFVVVIILVFAGIYFAAVQFHTGIKQAREKLGDFNDRTELSASMKGIKVSSPVLGVIILVISLVFFYLYLVYVFPIEDIF
ncbi:MAG TPA: hypothetical protein VJ919_18415 [Tangfeifania sp.]|nr:hypothetical protein [Tangfeifania sp.]